MKTTGCVAAIVLVAGFGVAAPASAKKTKLKGQVIGQPYAVKKSTVVPVLLDKRSGRRAHLRSRVGTLRITAKRVKAPRRTRLAPRLLRTGDVVKARAKFRRAARRSGYWQVKARKVVVKRRSATLSPAELQELVAALRRDLAQLGQTVVDFASYTLAEFRAVRAELASLRSDMNALRSEFATLAAQVAAANAELSALEAEVEGLGSEFQDVLADVAALNTAVASLGAQLTTLQGQVTGLTTDLATLNATVSTLSGQLTGVAPGDLSGALADIAALDTAIADAEGRLDGLETLVSAPGGLAEDVAGVQSDLGTLCGPSSPLDALC